MVFAVLNSDVLQARGTEKSMDARLILLLCVALSGTIQTAHAQGRPTGRLIGAPRAQVESQNFTVLASSEQLAQKVAQHAEAYRTELAMHWLGMTLPNWSSKCPIVVTDGEKLGAGGATTFTLSNRQIVRWEMNVQGTQERILDSVLPHEITHTVLATHFSKFDKTVPRWADEGASTTVEHVSEKAKNDRMLVEFLTTGRGIPFATLFRLKEYPPDILPMYAQGYSLSMFLIGQGGPRKFVQFLEQGVTTENWVAALSTHYGYSQLGKLQMAWNQWVADGGGELTNYTAVALAANDGSVSLASAVTPVNQPSERVASLEAPRQATPAGRFAVAQNSAPTRGADGFQSGSGVNSSSSAWQQRPNPNQTPASTDKSSTTVAENSSASPSQEYKFQPVDAAVYSRALPQPFQGVGSSPASVQFGPAEPLVR